MSVFQVSHNCLQLDRVFTDTLATIVRHYGGELESIVPIVAGS